MPIRPPQGLFRVDYVEAVSKESMPEPITRYVDREVIKEVEKVVFRDDPRLLEQLNKALKENGELKFELAKKPREVVNEKVIYDNVVKVVYKTSKQRDLAIIIVTMFIMFILCSLMSK